MPRICRIPGGGVIAQDMTIHRFMNCRRDFAAGIFRQYHGPPLVCRKGPPARSRYRTYGKIKIQFQRIRGQPLPPDLQISFRGKGNGFPVQFHLFQIRRDTQIQRRFRVGHHTDLHHRIVAIAVQDSIPPKAQPVIPEVNVSNTDSRAYLAAFYAALDSVRTMPVRVVHYGDSQIEEDRITNVLRERWQKQYGGGGVGLLPLHQTIPTRSMRQWLSMDGVVQTVQGGPKRYLVYGPRSMRLDNDEYGVMGQVAVMDSTLVAGSEDIVMCIEPIDKKRQGHNYFNRVRVLTDSVDGYILAQDTMLSPTPDTRHPLLYTLPDSTTKCEIHLQGKGKVYGVSLETPTGVIVDNIPMRGLFLCVEDILAQRTQSTHFILLTYQERDIVVATTI